MATRSHSGLSGKLDRSSDVSMVHRMQRARGRRLGIAFRILGFIAEDWDHTVSASAYTTRRFGSSADISKMVEFGLWISMFEAVSWV